MQDDSGTNGESTLEHALRLAEAIVNVSRGPHARVLAKGIANELEDLVRTPTLRPV